MRTKPAIAIVALLIAGLSAPALGQRGRPAAKKPRVINIGMVIDGPWQGNQAIVTVIRQEILDLTEGEFDVRFPADKEIVADWTPAGVKRAMDQALRDPQISIILAMGLLAANDVGQRPKLPKPVLAPFVVDAKLQGLPLENGRSGRKNFSYLTLPWSFERDLVAFREIASFDDLIVLSSELFLENIPGLRERVVESAKTQGVRATVISVGTSAAEALAKIPANAKAVYLAPVPHLSQAESDLLIQGLIDRKLPSFSSLGRFEVERGILAGTRPDSNFKRMGRRLAISVQRILLGDDPSRFTVNLKLAEQLVLNMKTARAIGLSPSWAVLTEAEQIGATRERIERQLSLASVAREAAESSVDVIAARQALAAGREDIRQARSNLLPQIEVSTTARVIDQDSAAGSFGAQPEFLWNGSLTASQVIYSEPAWSALAIQKDVQRSLEREYDTTHLDTVHGVAIAYLNVLRAKTAARIQQNNLKVTRKNLDLSRTRLNVGTANRAEVYRWESQIANDRKSVIEASAQRNASEIALNRILGRPIEERFATSETSLDDPALLTSQKELFQLLQNPWIFRVFRQFMVEEAVARAPELEQLDAAIAVQERALTSAKRAYFAPTVALQGSLNQRFYRAGEGSEPVSLIPGTEASDTPALTWSVGVVLSVPIFSGGSRPATIRKSEAELSQLRVQRRGARDLVAQRIGTAMHFMGSSYAGIRLSREAAEAAGKNLELITDAYGQGALSILELIDAQNAALVSEQVAANAVYDFLLDWMDVQRAAGQFDLLMDDKARRELFQRANAYVAKVRADEREPDASAPQPAPSPSPATPPAPTPPTQ